MTGSAATAGVISRLDGDVATLTLSNPARKNALTVQMWGELAAHVADLDRNSAVRTIIIRGAEGNFSSGLDLSYLIEGDLDARSSTDASGVTSPAERAITSATTPVVAAIEGYCFGGGALVAVAADIRIASSSARISLPPAKLGLVYPASSIRHLVALVGPSRAKLLLLTAEIVDAHQALEFGLVDRVLSPETFDDGVLRLTQSISRGSALTQASTKRLVETCIDRPEDLEAERDRWHSLALSSGELAEGIASFIEKRPPAFRWTSGGHQSG